jgi:hypothetical protein
MRGKIGRSTMRNKRGFLVPRRDNLLCFLGMFISFKASLAEIHYDLRLDFIL